MGEKKYKALRARKIVSQLGVTDPDIIKKVNNNSKFYNIHKNKRCFILGNGPSLKEVDLSRLKNEIVFSVNNFCKVDGYKEAKTNYHFWIDAAFFNQRKDMTYDMTDIMKNYQLMSEENAECFVPVYGYEFIKSNKLDEKLKINYLVNGGTYLDEPDNKIDISTVIPAFSTVVQYCICVAIYMGFSEIYLLGCDSTSVVTTINCALNQENKSMHAYKNDNSEKEINELLKNWDMADVFFDQYVLFGGYKYLNKYCNDNKIKLVNCTPKTLVNSIPMDSLDNVL